MNLGVLIGVLIYEIIVIFGVGFYLAKKRNKDEEGGFALAGRGMGVMVLASTMALTVLGAAHILGVFEMTYGMGAVAIWFSLAHVILIIVACFATGQWVRRLGVTTVPEALEGMYGKKISLAIGCVMAGVIWGILTLETQGVGIVIATMTGWGIVQGAIIGGILGIFYVVLAGMEEVGIVNVINSIVMYIGLIVATFFVATQLPGGNFDTVRDFFEADQAQAFMTNMFGTPDLFITFAIAQIIAVVFCQGISQMLMQACMAAKNEKTIRKAVWIAAPMNGMFGVFAVTLGLTARSIPEYAELGPKMAATTMLVDLLPGWVATLLLAALLAAILSTFAMTSLTPATIFAMDIYKGLFKKDATEKDVARVIRIMVVILGAIAIGVSAYLPPILGAINWVFAWIVPVFWLFVSGLFWKRSRGVAAATLIITWVVNMIWSFTGVAASIGGLFGSLPNGYITLLSTAVVLIIGNLAVKGEPAYLKVVEYKAAE
ncbi:sodium:solute symporter family protein [Sinanaerobacter chloroacetimidivorans]|jgi:SSS family solute:Na+ symporter|uniref:Sodium:solute symporter family protein n=1 Tax=Sinanaerobacter chloroacetimidivorans TaxID=2818044 RepID=A0A8J8B2Z7_9FIRM|nr:sodium:solute symporter family protein [Sinanaerobacter chloroacetimidivorans]MBR0599227.1 sodium:solute symporter family protein [Sinanaerobacter chloroacetimidivorans]